MGDSETFGIEAGRGSEVVSWLNEKAGEQKARLEARLYGYTISTDNFGDFEMFSWVGDAHAARKLLIRASKRFRVRVIEGGYRTKEASFSLQRSDHAKVKRGEKTIGTIEFEAPRIGRAQWTVQNEQRH